MHKKKLVFLDTETTGTGPDARLCQVAYKFNGEEFESLFKPPIPIEIDAMAVAHITNKMVAGKDPFQGSDMHRNLEQIFVSGNILVAHNAKFDAEILSREGLAIPKIIDTFKIAHHLDEGGIIPRYALQYLRYYFDLEVENAPAHDALGDIRVLEKIFDHLFLQMEKKHEDKEKIIEAMLNVSSQPILIRKFNFGKYNERKVSEIAREDPGYLAWLLNQKIMARERGEGNDEDWIYTLDYYLNQK